MDNLPPITHLQYKPIQVERAVLAAIEGI
jgi:hypothetical protein